MREAGVTIQHDMSFGDTLNQLKFLQVEFIALKKKMAFAAEQRMRAKVASYLAHDLRSPLLVFQEALRLQTLQELSAYKPRLFESISRIQFMINSLKDTDIKNIQASRISQFEMRAIIHEAKLLARERKIRILTQLEQGKEYLLDREKIERAVANLLHNAVELAKSFVTLRMHSKDTSLCVSVTDDGPGVPSEFDELIYKEHFSFGKAQGTGLGLSYAREVITAHGGSLTHFRQHGLTVFEMTLPGCVQTLTLCSKPDAHVVLPFPRPQRKNILILLRNTKLFNSLRSKRPNRHWIFKQAIDQATNLESFAIVYSDIPELIQIAIQKGVHPIVALASDCPLKATAKILRVWNLKI